MSVLAVVFLSLAGFADSTNYTFLSPWALPLNTSGAGYGHGGDTVHESHPFIIPYSQVRLPEFNSSLGTLTSIDYILSLCSTSATNLWNYHQPPAPIPPNGSANQYLLFRSIGVTLFADYPSTNSWSFPGGQVPSLGNGVIVPPFARGVESIFSASSYSYSGMITNAGPLDYLSRVGHLAWFDVTVLGEYGLSYTYAEPGGNRMTPSFQVGFSYTYNYTAVPEPTSMGLMMMAVCGFALLVVIRSRKFC